MTDSFGSNLYIAILTQKGRRFLKLKLTDHDELKWDGRPTEAWKYIAY